MRKLAALLRVDPEGLHNEQAHAFSPDWIVGLQCHHGPERTNDRTVATQMTTTTVTWATPTSGALAQDAIETSIANAGYKEVEGLAFKDGVWRTKARGGNKQWSKLAVGPVTGRVYPADAPSALNADEIKAKLTTAGYQNPTDVKFDDGLWSVSAKSPQGSDINLLVDPTDGSVVAQSRE